MGWLDVFLNIVVDGFSYVEEEEDTEEKEVVYSNLIANYGTITVDQVIAHEEQSYIWSDTRAAQDSYMFYQCLMSSLAPDAKKRIMVWSH